jgi:hypothetical protein
MDNLVDKVLVVAVGMRFNAGPGFYFHQNQTIALEMEPTNAHDANAVKVLLKNQEGRHVAYIGKRHSEQVTRILKDGVIHRVDYVPETSTELAATLQLTCESPALAYLKRRLAQRSQSNTDENEQT